MSDSSFLHRYFLNNSGKRLHKWLHYFDIYEKHFARFRNKSPVMLELGVMGGGSLAMWKEYFGPGAKIIGLDINPECKKHEAENVEIFIGSQSDPALLGQIKEKYPNIDIVLDDASHYSSYMISTFKQMYEHVQPNGIYMLEDCHACYWTDWDGGFRHPKTFIEFSKDLIDHLNAVHTRGELAPTQFTRTTDSISFYDSIVVFERRPQGVRACPMTIGMSEPEERHTSA